MADTTKTQTRSKKATKEKVEEAPISIVLGVVTDCVGLRVRSTPEIKDNNTIGELGFASEVSVNLIESTDDFYSVRTESGLAGYCMKKFINISTSEV